MSDAGAMRVAPNDANSIRGNWIGFLFLGIVLIAGGCFAIMSPVATMTATSIVLGGALVVTGVVKIVQTLQVKKWIGFVWQLLAGAVEIVGGLLIYLNPLKGAVAIALLMAIVFGLHAITQFGLAIQLRPQGGWVWVLGSASIALLVSLALVFKLPMAVRMDPGQVAGIALLAAGIAYLAIAYAVRRAGR